MPGRKIGGYVLWEGESLRDSGHLQEANDLLLHPEQGEVEDYRVLGTLLDRAHPHWVILERPFLFLIAQLIGAAKFWCMGHRIPWWQIQASTAKKAVIGHGRASKPTVRAWALKHPLMQGRACSQHVADALLYLEAWKILSQR